MPHPENIALIFPHQLFKKHPALKAVKTALLVEEYLFFTQYHFHKRKLALHRASMQAYAAFLESMEIDVSYIDAQQKEHDVRKLLKHVKNKGALVLHIADVVDDWLRRRIIAGAKKYKLEIKWYTSPNYVTPADEANTFFDGRKRYFMADFYMWQRKRMQVLVEPDNSPVGGRWSFDEDNREKLPKNHKALPVIFPAKHKYYEEAIDYVKKFYPHNPGEIDGIYHYPATFEDAEKWLHNFLQERLNLFGPYEDALAVQEHFLYHSVLTPMLNTGLLNPGDVIQETIKAAQKLKTPINSLEGFVRQVIGWREYIRIVYEREGRKQRTKNFWGFTRRLPKSFYDGTTGIEPVDNVIRKTLKTGYSHHIERLMIMGNFMLLCEFDPNEVYRWFMEFYVDAYDWVMVPNVYGMTQFADGGLMTTKPYISGSNYLTKMSNYKKGEWQEIWDGLFWRFMTVHADVMGKNQRIGMLLKSWEKMSAEKKEVHLNNAENFLQRLDNEPPAWDY